MCGAIEGMFNSLASCAASFAWFSCCWISCLDLLFMHEQVKVSQPTWTAFGQVQQVTLHLLALCHWQAHACYYGAILFVLRQQYQASDHRCASRCALWAVFNTHQVDA
jgi:hypothetical protein